MPLAWISDCQGVLLQAYESAIALDDRQALATVEAQAGYLAGVECSTNRWQKHAEMSESGPFQLVRVFLRARAGRGEPPVDPRTEHTREDPEDRPLEYWSLEFLRQILRKAPRTSYALPGAATFTAAALSSTPCSRKRERGTRWRASTLREYSYPEARKAVVPPHARGPRKGRAKWRARPREGLLAITVERQCT